MVVHADGASGGAADEERRHALHHIYGSQMVVKNYNVMGVAKAGLEAAVRYIAAELGPKGIRVHAISPGPLVTRAASGIPEFDEVMDKAQTTAPTRSLVSIDDVGAATAFLALARRREAHHGRRHVYRRRVSHHRLRHEAHKRSHIVWPILRRGKAIHLRRHPYVASISRRRNRQRL